MVQNEPTVDEIANKIEGAFFERPLEPIDDTEHDQNIQGDNRTAD